MTWLAPWALGAGALGMLGVIAAHLLARQRPRALTLATARFLPAGMLEATTIQPLPMDRWWMALRLAILALLALGLAQPVPSGTRVAQRTVLLLDRTLPVAAQRLARAGLLATDAVITFDTVATLAPSGASSGDSAHTHEFADATSRASLGSAMALLARSRDSLARDADALRIVLASPLADGTLDPATPALRALVPDSISVVPVTVALDSVPPRGAVSVRSDGDDPIAATALLLGDSVAPAGTRIVRVETLAADDTLAARNGATVVHWPAREVSAVPALQGLTVQRTTWVAALGRDTAYIAPRAIAPIGWWADGTPAVWRERLGRGCVLQVRAALPVAGDQTLSLSAQAWLAALLTSCDAPPRAARVAPTWLTAAPSARIASTATETRRSTLAPWLVGAALLLAALELLLRLRRAA